VPEFALMAGERNMTDHHSQRARRYAFAKWRRSGK
jgi:hypothetical protein